MGEKESPDATDGSRNEDVPIAKTELVEATGRRQSVALNIVENPLTVSFPDLSLYYSCTCIECWN